MKGFSTASRVIIAVPHLQDPNFHRAVVVMIQHDPKGALGLILNAPTTHHCTELVDSFGVPWPGHPEAVICRGGPVEPQSLWMLHDDGWGFPETMRVSDGVAVSRSREALTRMCNGGEEHLRLLVGYAGWGPGQLENEIATGSWIVGEASTAMVFDWPPEDIWRQSLDALGINPAFLVEGGHLIQ